jgi:phosphoribosylamine--glycine ligase
VASACSSTTPGSATRGTQEAIINGTLARQPVEFERRATVCKYVVPDGYPENPVRNERIGRGRVPPQSERLKYYTAAVEERAGGL